MKKRLFRPPAFALAAALLVFGVLTIARDAGWLQRWELSAYDIMLRERCHAPTADAGITIIGIGEDDIRTLDYPLHDVELAAVLQKILDAGPRAIGLDLYRDLREPRSGEGLAQLEAVMKSADNLITIFTPDYPGKPGSGVPAPIALQSLPEADRTDRITFNEFPMDRIGTVVRRAPIFEQAQEDGLAAGIYFSFAFRLALLDLPKAAEARHLPMPSLEFIPQDAPETVRLGRAVFRRFHSNDGGYYGEDDGGFQFLIDYRTLPKYPTYSLADLVEDRVPVKDLRDRVVLIGGVGDLSIKDSVPTPLDPRCRGVAVHAQVIEQIRRAALDGEQPTRVLPGWVHPLWTLLWSLLGGASALALLRWPKVAPVALASGLLALLGIKYVAFLKGLWLPPVEPGLAYISSAVAALLFVFVWERSQRSHLMKMFSRYVSTAVAKSLWEQREAFFDGNRPVPQRVTATVLFTDFVGFSTVSENMDAESLMSWLNEGMDHLTQHVEPNGGIVNKYIGDAIMAVFGVPSPRRTDAEISLDATNAVRCALKMGRELERLNAEWASVGKPQIGMRIGIHTGSLVAGSMGADERIEYTVIGDTVNTASRLESSKKEEIGPPEGRCCRILISEATYQLLGGRFSVEPAGAISLKGKANLVIAYSVLDEIEVNQTTESTVPVAV